MIRQLIVHSLILYGFADVKNESFPPGQVEEFNLFLSGAAHPKCESLLNSSTSMGTKYGEVLNQLKKTLPTDCFGQLGVKIRLDGTRRHLCSNGQIFMFQLGSNLTGLDDSEWSLMMDEPIVTGLEAKFRAGRLIRLQPVASEQDLCKSLEDGLPMEWLNHNESLDYLRPVIQFGQSTSRMALSLLDNEMQPLNLSEAVGTEILTVRFSLLYPFAGRNTALTHSVSKKYFSFPNKESFEVSSLIDHKEGDLTPSACKTVPGKIRTSHILPEKDKRGCSSRLTYEVALNKPLDALSKDQRGEFHYVFQLGEDDFFGPSPWTASLNGIFFKPPFEGEDAAVEFELVVLPSAKNEEIARGRLVHSKTVIHRGGNLNDLASLHIPLSPQTARISLKFMNNWTEAKMEAGKFVTSIILRLSSGIDTGYDD